MEGLRWKTSGFRGKRLGTFPAPWAAERHTRAADHDRCDVVRLPADECHARGASAHECYVRPALETFVRGPPAAETSHLERARAHAGQRAAGAVGPGGRDALGRTGAGGARRPGCLPDRAQDRLDPRGLDLRDAAGPDRQLDLVDWRIADLLPGSEPLAERQIGDVAIAVVGRLRQHRQNQLRDRVAVRHGEWDAIDEPQPVANRADPAARRRLPATQAPPIARRPAPRPPPPRAP